MLVGIPFGKKLILIKIKEKNSIKIIKIIIFKKDIFKNFSIYFEYIYFTSNMYLL